MLRRTANSSETSAKGRSRAAMRVASSIAGRIAQTEEVGGQLSVVDSERALSIEMKRPTQAKEACVGHPRAGGLRRRRRRSNTTLKAKTIAIIANVIWRPRFMAWVASAALAEGSPGPDTSAKYPVRSKRSEITRAAASIARRTLARARVHQGRMKLTIPRDIDATITARTGQKKLCQTGTMVLARHRPAVRCRSEYGKVNPPGSEE